MIDAVVVDLALAAQRNGIVDIVPGGTIDIQRVIMARTLGLGRSK